MSPRLLASAATKEDIQSILKAIAELERAAATDRFSLETIKAGIGSLGIIQKDVRDLQEGAKLNAKDMTDLRAEMTKMWSNWDEMKLWRDAINNRNSQQQGALKAIHIIWGLIGIIIGWLVSLFRR